MDPKALKSILGHFIVAAVGGIGLLLAGWVTAHPDPTSWTIADLKVAAFVALIATLKKFFAGELLGTNG